MLKLSHVELLCIALHCEPNDLFAFSPTKGKIYPEKHLLLNLQNNSALKSLEDNMANMPFSTIKQLWGSVINQTKQTDE